MPPPDPATRRLTRGWYLAAAACILTAYALTTASHFTQGELGLDDASTFLVARRPLRDVVAQAMSFHSQPPLFYVALHEWLRLGDTEPVLRALPMTFMIGAFVTLASASWLPPLARLVAGALLLLTPYSDFLTGALRPYSLSAWLSLWSCLLFQAVLFGPRRRAARCLPYIVVTLLMAYSVAMALWTLVAQGVCAACALAVTIRRRGIPGTVTRHAPILASLAIVGAAYWPYVITVWSLNGHLGHPTLGGSIASAINPRYFVSGPMYLFTMPLGLGYLALAAAGYAVWNGSRRMDSFVGTLLAVVLVQISLTHGFLEGRSDFSFRYLAPAYPALCLLAGLGVDRLVGSARSVNHVVAVLAAGVVGAALVVFFRAPHAAPVGPWRQVRADLAQLPGSKVVFFDIGWDAMRLEYEVRHDSEVRIMSDQGSGWDTGGRLMTPDYVTRTIDDTVGATTMFFYEFDPVTHPAVFDEAFAPAMVRHRCERVYRRDVPTYSRNVPGDAGALLYGYACHGV